MEKPINTYFFTFKCADGHWGWNTVYATNASTARKLVREKLATFSNVTGEFRGLRKITNQEHRLLLID
jgi:hypothetical protein